MTVPLAAALAVAAADPNPVVDPNLVTPGLAGFVFFVLLIVALYFLMKSMARQLRRVDPQLPRSKQPVQLPVVSAESAAGPDDGPAPRP